MVALNFSLNNNKPDIETSEEYEAADSVFPLPDIGTKPRRTLSRDTAKTSSVKC